MKTQRQSPEMSYTEIIQGLRNMDDAVVRRFFFDNGPVVHCATCKPSLVNVLNKVYGSAFNYDERLSAFYSHLLEGDKLSGINDPSRLMGWISTTAYHFFIKEKKCEDSMSRKMDSDFSRIDELDDDKPARYRAFVSEVLNAMPNRDYAKVIDEIVLELYQYSGQKKITLRRCIERNLNVSREYLDVKINRAMKQFKTTAMKLAYSVAC